MPSAGEAALKSLAAGCDFRLPDEYLALLRFSNGGEGALCIEPWWFQLWPAEEVLDLNRGYCIPEFLPGYLGIGSNAAGELLAIRKSDGSPCPIYMIPFCPMAESDGIQICHDMEMFAMALGRETGTS